MRKLSHSSMSCWRRCKYKYFLKYIENYVLPSSMGQIRGSIGHSALAVWYKTGDKDEALHAANDKLFEYEMELNRGLDDVWELMKFILNRYFEWSIENDKFELIEAELKFEFKIDKHVFLGYIDGVVEIDGIIWLLEHKFLKQVSMKHVSIDPQISMYMLAMRKLEFNPRGTFFNVIRMTKGGIAKTEPVVRVKAFRNQEGLVAIERELVNQANEMTKFHRDGGEMYRNSTRDCTWDCNFYPVCLSINDSGEAKSVLKTFEKRLK
ncbi:hypothetical protein LCGC14_0466440 [marine sediment metagenome]|uniref:PD-(D/E)XK endonuclease-like domain-containing protein n=1 Tax=marine sediment metagenome TaxID=412755 RepID=A0A0F9SIS7_9ZZZZ